MVSKFDSRGLRIKLPKFISKERILSELKLVLDQLESEGGAETFSGINIYFQMHNKNGEKIVALKGNEVISGLLFSEDGKEGFTFGKVGISFSTLAQVNMQNSIREGQELKEALKSRQEREERLAREREIKDRQFNNISEIGAMICKEFGVKKASEVASSIAYIKDKRAILKYINEHEIPMSGLVIRASIKDATTKRTSSYRIYGEDLKLIKTVSVIYGSG